MQYTRNTTMTKTDRDTLRSLHGRKKWEHIWAYYKLPIAIVLIVVYILGYAAYRHVTKKEDVLYLGLVNITAGSDLTEQLTTGFAEAQGLTKKATGRSAVRLAAQRKRTRRGAVCICFGDEAAGCSQCPAVGCCSDGRICTGSTVGR